MASSDAPDTSIGVLGEGFCISNTALTLLPPSGLLPLLARSGDVIRAQGLMGFVGRGPLSTILF